MEHKVNAGFTLFLRVVRDGEGEGLDEVAALRAVLAGWDAAQGTPANALPFSRMETTHFATVTTIAAKRYGDELMPPLLMFCTSYCGPREAHVAELVACCGAGMRKIFAMCREAAFDPACTDEQLADFLLANQNGGDAFYSKMQFLSPEDVRRHHALRAAIETYVDEHAARLAGLTPRAIHAELRATFSADPAFAWIAEPFGPSRREWWILRWRAVAVLAGAGLYAALLAGATLGCILGCRLCHPIAIAGWAIVAAAVAGVIGLVVAMRRAELEQTYIAQRKPDDFARMLAQTQRRAIINEFTLDGPVKPGWLRPTVLRMALWAIARAAEGVPKLFPDGIDIPTVATARWMTSDGGKRVLFISNYTNPAEPYVRDFIDTRGGAMRINLSFGFGSGFPLTRWVLWDGALTDPNAYIYAVADHQSATAFWYGPYKDISIDNIHVNRKIREGLVADFSPDKFRATPAIPASDGKPAVPAITAEQAADTAAQDWLHLL